MNPLNTQQVWSLLKAELRTAPPAATTVGASKIPPVDRRTPFVTTINQTITPSPTGGLPTVSGGTQFTYSFSQMPEDAVPKAGLWDGTPSPNANVLAEMITNGVYSKAIKGTLADFAKYGTGWPLITEAEYLAQQAALATKKII